LIEINPSIDIHIWADIAFHTACKKKYNGIYVLAKENVIIRELGERVANMIPNTKINYTEISFQDARNYKVDNQKSLKTFTYKPIKSITPVIN
jgi:hypothetical protein